MLYSIFAADESDAGLILEHIAKEKSDTSNVNSKCIASVQYDLVANAWRVDLMGSAITPEIVGSCWNALIDVHVSFPREVWLGTYDAATISRVAPVRLRVIGGSGGYVLRPNELDALLDLPVG